MIDWLLSAAERDAWHSTFWRIGMLMRPSWRALARRVRRWKARRRLRTNVVTPLCVELENAPRDGTPIEVRSPSAVHFTSLTTSNLQRTMKEVYAQYLAEKRWVDPRDFNDHSSGLHNTVQGLTTSITDDWVAFSTALKEQ